MSINSKIRTLGEGLKDRIDASIIDFDLEYIEHSESVLAFETICDHIADYDAIITKDEYNLIINIANELNLKIDNRYLYINPDNKL